MATITATATVDTFGTDEIRIYAILMGFHLSANSCSNGKAAESRVIHQITMCTRVLCVCAAMMTAFIQQLLEAEPGKYEQKILYFVPTFMRSEGDGFFPLKYVAVTLFKIIIW